MPHNTASKQAMGQFAVHEPSISSLCLGMLRVGAWGCSQQHLQQSGSSIQDFQLIFMGKLCFWKVPMAMEFVKGGNVILKPLNTHEEFLISSNSKSGQRLGEKKHLQNPSHQTISNFHLQCLKHRPSNS